MIKGCIKMIMDWLMPSDYHSSAAQLEHASRIHAMSAIAVSAEARKMDLRLGDMRTIADAAEKRARERGIVPAIDDALNLPSMGGPRESSEIDRC